MRLLFCLPLLLAPLATDAANPKIVPQLGHTFHVSAVCFSPDGKYVLTGSGDKTARFWETTTGRELRVFEGHASSVSDVGFSPDGKTALTASARGTVRLWDVRSGRELRRCNGKLSSSAAFTPDGKRILTGGNITPQMWDARTAQNLNLFSGYALGVRSISFTPDGTSVVLAGSNPELWDLRTGRKVREYAGHVGYCRAAAVSPDGASVVTGGTDGTVKLWNLNSGRELRSLAGHSRDVISVDFGPNGRLLLSGSEDKTARVWDAAAGRHLRTLTHSEVVTSVKFSPDGKFILTGSNDNTAKLWDTQTGEQLLTYAGNSQPVTAVRFSSDGRSIVTGSEDGMTRAWSWSNERRVYFGAKHTGGAMSVTFSPDGKQLLSGGGVDKTAALTDLASGRERFRLRGHTSGVYSVDFSPDGRKILTGSSDGTAQLWDASSGRRVRVLEGHEYSLNVAIFSPDGQKVLTGSKDETAKLWDVASGRELRTFQGHTGWIRCAAFSPDGQLVATGAQGHVSFDRPSDHTARIWSVASGQELRRFSGHGGAVTSIAFSPDGRSVLTGSWDKSCRLWDVQTGREIRRFDGHGSSVNSVCFSPDGRFIASGSVDGSCRIWNTTTGREVCTLVGLTNSDDWLVYTPEGLFDGSVRARELICYRVGAAGDVVPVDQYFDNFYLPGLLPLLLAGKRARPSASIATPPEVRIVSLYPDTTVDSDQQTIQVEVTTSTPGQAPAEIFLTINGRRLLTAEPMRRLDATTYRRSFPLLLARGKNKIVAKAEGAGGSGEGVSEPLTLVFEEPPEKVTLYVVAIGVGDYADNDLDLTYPAADASALGDLFQRRSRGLFRSVAVKELLDEHVTGPNIKAAFQEVGESATPDDVLIVVLAGHGHAIGTRYYFLPHGLRVPDPSRFDTAVRAGGIPSDQLGEWMRPVKAQKCALILDTCNAGAAIHQLVLARADRLPFGFRKAIERLKRSEGVFIIAGAAAGAEAKEQSDLKHGLLTYSLLAGAGATEVGPFANTPAEVGMSDDGILDVRDWFRDAENKTQALMSRYYERDVDIPIFTEGIAFPLLPLDR